MARVRRWWGMAGLGSLLVAGLAGPSAAASWTLEDGGSRLVLADGPEDTQFVALCEDGVLNTIYFAPDRAELSSGVQKACEAERPCRERLPVSLLVDGRATTILARAQPEEMYGGYEIHFSLKATESFWSDLGKGQALSMKIDGKTGETLSLKGIQKPLTKLLAACKR